MSGGVLALLLIVAAAALGLIVAGLVIEVRAHLARRDRVSPIIRSRVAARVQRRGSAL